MPSSCIAFKAMASSRAMGTIYFSSSLSLVARICHISGLSVSATTIRARKQSSFFLSKKENDLNIPTFAHCHQGNIRWQSKAGNVFERRQKWYWHFWCGCPWAASRPWSRVGWPQCCHPLPAHGFCSHGSRRRWLWGQRHDCWPDQSWNDKIFEREILMGD